MMNNNALKGPANPRYKTMMCKNYNTEQGCQYGEKCQFAHGVEELRTYHGNGTQPQAQPGMPPQQQMQKNIMNYKIVKCKNFEKDGVCKYGSHCTFAHGDEELRSKVDPLTQQQMAQMAQMGQMPMMMPQNYMMDYQMMMMPGMMQGMPQGFDYSQMDPNMMMQPGFDMTQAQNMAQGQPMPQAQEPQK